MNYFGSFARQERFAAGKSIAEPILVGPFAGKSATRPTFAMGVERFFSFEHHRQRRAEHRAALLNLGLHVEDTAEDLFRSRRTAGDVDVQPA